MRKIVFINTSYWAWGELTIAIQFAKRLKRAECLFIVPPSHESRIKRSGFEYRILIPHGKRLNRLTFSEVQSAFGPDLVILSDLLNYAFCDTHYGLTFEDLELFKCSCGGLIYRLKKICRKVILLGLLTEKLKALISVIYHFSCSLVRFFHHLPINRQAQFVTHCLRCRNR